MRFLSAFHCPPVSAFSSLQPCWWRAHGLCCQCAIKICSIGRGSAATRSDGIINLGHSFLFLLLCCRMVMWEAALCWIYVIAKMLIAAHFLKWKWRDHIPVWLCCVVLKAGFFCGSIKPGLLTQVIMSRFSKNVDTVQKFWKSTE